MFLPPTYLVFCSVVKTTLCFIPQGFEGDLSFIHKSLPAYDGGHVGCASLFVIRVSLTVFFLFSFFN